MLCYLYLARVDKGEFQSVSVAGQIIGTFLGKGQENRERDRSRKRKMERERRAQRVPLSLLVMRGCRGAVAAPNYYQAAATAGSNGPCRAPAQTHQCEEREREKGEATVAPLHPSHPLLRAAATLTGSHQLCLPHQLLRTEIAGWCVGAASVNMAGNVSQSLFMALAVCLSRNAGTTCLANEQMAQTKQ